MDFDLATFGPSALAVITGLFSGFLGRRFEDILFKPKLEVEFDFNKDGFRTEVSWKNADEDISDVYIRACVRNVGNYTAKQCRPYLIKLEEIHPSGKVSTSLSDSFALPWPLGEFGARDIPPGVNFFFDIARVSKHTSGWKFTFKEVFSSNKGLANHRGTYRFTILITGDSVKTSKIQIDVAYDGDWKSLRAFKVKS